MGLQQPLNQPKQKKRAQTSLTDVTALIKYLANTLWLLTADFDQNKKISDDSSIMISFMTFKTLDTFLAWWTQYCSIVIAT